MLINMSKDNICSCLHPQYEQLYVEVLYTIKHKIGATTAGHLPYLQDLYLYAREAFRVTPEDHARLLARASQSKVCEAKTGTSSSIIQPLVF